MLISNLLLQKIFYLLYLMVPSKDINHSSRGTGINNSEAFFRLETSNCIKTTASS